jgi:hypothetical protein
VTVLGKRISSDAVVRVNADVTLHPKPVSFESAKPKQHASSSRAAREQTSQPGAVGGEQLIKSSRHLQDISNKPRPSRAQSAVSPKILSKIKIYSQTGQMPLTTKKDQPAKKPRPPKAPRSGKSKDQKVPRLPVETVAKPSKRESPHMSLTPKINEIVQLTLKEAYEEKLRGQEELSRKREEKHNKKQLLKEQNLQIRRENRRFQGNHFKPKAAWGIDQRKIYGDEKSRTEARQNRERKLIKRTRAKSAGKDRIGLEVLNEIKAELRPRVRSHSATDKQLSFIETRPAKEVRQPDPSVQDYMRNKQQTIKVLQERQSISQLAMEAKRLSQLRDLDTKAKIAINKFKRKRRKTKAKKRKTPALLQTDLSNTGGFLEDDEVLSIMHRLNSQRSAPAEREGRESRVFGVLQKQGVLTEAQGNASQGFQSKDKGLSLIGNATAPINMKEEWSHFELPSQVSSKPYLVDPAESSIFSEESLGFSEVSKHKEVIHRKVADLRKRGDEIKLKVRDEAVVTPLKREATEETPLNLPVIHAADFELMMQEEAAVEIQSSVRRFLAVSKFQRYKAELSEEELSFHSDEIEAKLPEKSKLSDRLRIGIRDDFEYSEESEPGLLDSSSGEEEEEEAEEAEEAEEEVGEVKRPTSDPNRRTRSEDSDDLELILGRPRASNPVLEDSEGEEELQEILLHELQQMKDREEALENLIEQHQSRQEAEEAKRNQMEEDLARLREYDRQMLEDVAARSGASMLTGLLNGLFEQRYRRIEDVFKGNGQGLQEAISGDLPYFEQLEQCLKETEGAKKPHRGPNHDVSVDTDQGVRSSQDSIVSLDEATSYELMRVKDREARQRDEFAAEIAQLEQELYEQEIAPRPSKLGGRQDLNRQPFSGLLTGLSDQKAEELEQHISDLSAEIEGSDDSEASLHVINRPFEMVAVYISTEEDQLTHEESPVSADSTSYAFPVLNRLVFKSPEEPLPEVPDFPKPTEETKPEKARGSSADELALEDFEEKVAELADEILVNLLRESFEVLKEVRARVLEQEGSQAAAFNKIMLSDLLPAEFPRPLALQPSLPHLSLESLSQSMDQSSYRDFGLMTDVETVLAYTAEVFAFALSSADSQPRVCEPLQTDPKQLLEQLQDPELSSYSSLVLTKAPEVIHVDCYIELENSRNPCASNRMALSPNTAQAVAEAENIHNKMIFDCINEALTSHLPYGLKGVPMPWSCSTRALAVDSCDMARILTAVQDSISRWGSIQAGKLPSGEMVLSSGLVDEEYLTHVRLERLEACITMELMENDEAWVNYEYEETQAKLDLADIVLDHLVTEALALIQTIS